VKRWANWDTFWPSLACYTFEMEHLPDVIEIHSSKTITIGVVADTHIPDRVNGLHPNLLGELCERNVDYIFHTGDLSSRKVLEELQSVAPVFAVRGNRDFLVKPKLPIILVFIINDVRILLTHGHLSPVVYWSDKIANIHHGYEVGRYVHRLQRVDPRAQIYVFGHTHQAENSLIDNKIFFNPGGSSVGSPVKKLLSFGVLRIEPDGNVVREIVPLTGAVVKLKRWENGESHHHREDNNS